MLALVATASLAAAGCTASGTTSAPSRTPATSPAASTGFATASPSARASALPSATVQPSTGPVAAAWRLVELPDSAAVGQIADVVAGSGSVTAAAAAGPAEAARAMAWTSLDRGATWSTESLPGPAGSLDRLVSWGNRLLAMGEGDGDCAHPSIVEIWVRSAAGDWQAAPFDPLLCAGGTAEAAASGARAVIVGTGAGDVPYAWSSADGLHWADHSGIFSGRLPQGLAADGAGFLATGVGGASAWVAQTPDGATWGAPHGIPGPAGMTIIGDPVDLDGQPAIFASDPAGAVGVLRPDGHGGWRSAPSDGLRGDAVRRIVSIGSGLVALGGDEHGPLLWVSADGTSWHPAALPDEVASSAASATLTGVAVAAGRAYLAGQMPAKNGGRAIGALWTGPASLLAP